MINKLEIDGFYKTNLFSSDYADKTLKLQEYFLEKGPHTTYDENELQGAFIWAIIILNRPFEKKFELEKVAGHFGLDCGKIEIITDDILQTVSIFDKRFFVKQVIDQINKNSLHINKTIRDFQHSTDHFYEEALKLYDQGENLNALCSFFSLFDFIYKNENKFSTEDILGYTLSILSNIGHVYWDEEEMLRARHSFRNGIHIIESAFDNITGTQLDCQNKNHLALLFILEDYASVQYAMGKLDDANAYFGLLHKLDSENILQAENALRFLEQGKGWNEYVDYIDNIADSEIKNNREFPGVI